MSKREDVKFEAPSGRLYTQALREEARIDEKNEKFTRATRLRAQADRLDTLCDSFKKAKQ